MTLAEAMEANGLAGPAPRDVTLRVAPPWLRRLWVGPVSAMAGRDTIWLSPDAMRRVEAGEAAPLLRHELAHVAQWRSHGRVGFLGQYIGDYLLARLGGFSHATAYRAIRFEQAADAEAVRER